MADHNYPWPRYNVGPKDHLYALGVISLNFNLYEYSLIVFLEMHFRKDISAFLTAKLSNEERSHLIRMIMNSDYDPKVTDEVEFILRHFATCAENRHNLLHSRPGFPILGTDQKEVLALEKFARGEPEKLLAFQLEIGDLHRAADEMRAGFEYMISLWRYFFDREHYFKLMTAAEDDGLPFPPDSAHPTLPKRPPEPRKINPSPFGEAG
jgi:hypothetical protein